MRARLAAVALAAVAALVGGWLVGRWCLGVVLIAEAACAVAWAVFWDDGKPVQEPGVLGPLERARRAA